MDSSASPIPDEKLTNLYGLSWQWGIVILASIAFLAFLIAAKGLGPENPSEYRLVSNFLLALVALILLYLAGIATFSRYDVWNQENITNIT